MGIASSITSILLSIKNKNMEAINVGKLFDKLNNAESSTPIEKYLEGKNFYKDTMHPRFMNGNCYGQLTIGIPCLRHDSSINDDCTLRIFINEIDIYFEVQTPYSSYETSDRYDPKDYPTVASIDNLLGEILERVLD